MPVNSPHVDYLSRQQQWQRCRDCYEGQDAVKARRTTYLPALEGQKATDDSYSRYLDRALFYPTVERTVFGLVGMLLRKPPTLVVPDVVREDLRDLTLALDPFDMVLLRLCTEVLLGGRVGVVVDWRDAAERPYWSIYATEDVLNWCEDVVHGTRQLTRVVLREEATQDGKDPFVPERVVQYRVFTLDDAGVTAQVWRKVGDDFAPVEEYVPTRKGKALDAIPCVVFGSRGVFISPDKPPLLDLVDLNLSHYRSSADLEHGRHFTALPTPYVTGWSGSDQPMQVGSGTAWMIPDAAAKVGMLEFTGAGLSEVRMALEQKERQMAVVGARLLEQQPARAETAETVRLRQSGETATLSTIADAIGLGVQACLRWHGWWYGVEPLSIEAALSKDFLDSRITAQEAQALMTLWQGGGISYATLYWNLQQGEWARPDVPVEQERAEIAADDDLDEDVPPPPVAPVPVAPPEEPRSDDGMAVEPDDDEA